MIALLLACATPPETCTTESDWQGWTQGFFVSYCDACHAADTPDRHGAPAGVSFDTEAEARRWAARIWIRVLTQEDMPPAGGVFPEDQARLQEWLACP